jgi:hypothetical protein
MNGDHSMEVVEQLVVGKLGDTAACEDGIVVTDAFAAVIDGSTDKTGDRYDGSTGGVFALHACAEAVRSLDPAATMYEAVTHLTEVLSGRLPPDLPPQHRPTAVVAVYSRLRRELWQIGDVSIWHAGLQPGGTRAAKQIDQHAATLRSAILHAELANGATASHLRADDPGRRAIVPLLVAGTVFCNNPNAGEWAYPAVNGLPIPARLVIARQVPAHVTEVVLASDGYPRALPTLSESEQALAGLLATDPLCIGPLLGTKGVLPGNASYDDRAYLRIRTGTVRSGGS